MNPTPSSPSDRVLRALREARTRIEQLERERSEPIAIIGMACRFPGGADSPEAFWTLLSEGRDAVRELPAERDQAVGSAWSERLPPHVRRAGFLREEVDGFDHRLFGISSAEALAMDPQQRMLLETSWQALEGAGLDPHGLRGSATGVWVGISNADYSQSQLRRAQEHIDAYTLTGATLSVAAGRLAYTYGLRGPAVALDTACSSSLVALHLAVQSLRSGETELALVGGVQLILEPEIALGLERMAALSPDGRCKTFDASANGFVRGEGCAVLVLRRLSEARHRREPVRAVVAGSATNQDGASSSLTAPNGTAQREVVRAALANARLSPSDVDYIEAHGTGTALGDPIELHALADVFHERQRPLVIGSVKTNIGHLEAAAGLAGLMKVVLALEHGTLPPHLHLEHPTGHFDWRGHRLEVATQSRPWPAGEHPRVAGISSFGFSGTNAHVVIREAPSEAVAEQARRPVELLPLSARTPTALDPLRARWAEALPNLELASACHTARVGRAHLEHRRVFLGGSARELEAALRANQGLVPTPLEAGAPGTVWLFTGQGSQYPGMARGLHEAEPAFRQALDECDKLLRPHLGAPLTELLFGSDAETLARTGLSQPAIFAVQVALARMWQAWGVSPSALLGHSVGEFAAAYVAGVLSLEDACALVAARGQLMQALPEGGAMASVRASAERVAEWVRPHGGRLVIAAVNGPAAVSVSGEAAALDEFLRRLEAEGIRARRLPVSHAFHSPLMDSVRQPLRRVAQGLTWNEATLPLFSTVHGRLATAGELASAEYWCEQVVRPVRFAEALAAADAAGYRQYLELGPSATLTGLGMECLPGRERLWLSSLRQGQEDGRSVLHALGQLYVNGTEIDWAAFDAGRALPRVRVPSYPFDRQRFWRHIQAPTSAAPPAAPSAPSLGAAPAAVEPRQAILQRLLDMLASTTGMALGELDPQANLFTLGIDSIMLIQLRQLVAREYGVEFELSLAYEEASSLALLADYIHAHAAPPSGEPTLASIAAQVQLLNQQIQQLAAASSQPRPASPPPRAPRPATRPPSAVLPNRPGKSSASAELAERQRQYIQAFSPRYNTLTAHSKEYAVRHRAHFASGRNLAGFRADWKELIYQLVAGRGEGASIQDVDGRTYRDFSMGFGSALLGHNPPCVRETLKRELERGMPVGPLSDMAGVLAERVHQLTGVDRVAFFNSGSDAVMNALRIARTVTGRNKVALFEGSYHGTFDGVLALGVDGTTVPVSPGSTPGMVEDVLVLPYGEAEALELLERHAGQLAAVLVEPVQSRRPALQPREFVRALREFTERHDVALILDEMITGFRCHPGGIQARWGIQADLVTYGKILGGGMPIGAVAGKARFMDAVDGGPWSYGDGSVPMAATTFTSGTFCNHPAAMAAGSAVLERLQQDGPALLERLDAMTTRLCERLNAFYEAEALPLRMVWFSSLFRFSFDGDLELLYVHLLERGIYVWEGRNCFLSAAHTDEDVDAFVAAVQDSLRVMRAAGLVPQRRPSASASGERVLPASPAQRRLFFLHQFDEAEAAYHLHEARIIHGPLDVRRLSEALAEVIARHESLRTGFELSGAEPLQHIFPRVEPRVEVLAQEGADPLEQVSRLLKPFDLARPPLLRMHVVRLGPERHLLHLDVHHIACDGLSFNLLVAELLELYRGHPLPPPTRQYSDFSTRHLALMASPEGQRQEAWWLERFSGELPVLDLPADFPRPPVARFEGGVVRAELPVEQVRQLKALARDAGSTLYSVLLTAYGVLLQRLSGQRDLVIGTPIAGRPGSDFDRTVGMFVATLPLRLRLEPSASFLEQLKATTRWVLGAFDNADLPLERLVEKLTPQRDPGRNPLFDTMFEFETADSRPLEVEGLRLEPLAFHDGTAMFDLDVENVLEGDRLSVRFKYRTSLFRHDTAERMLRGYTSLLEGIVRAPATAVRDLPLHDARERQRLLTAWNDTAVAFPESTLHGLFEAQARRVPEQVALLHEEQALTYRELDEKAERLARRLRAEGVGPERFVGIFMERSFELIVAFLGVLKAGGAYVPLDPEYPAARIDVLTQELGRPLVLTQEHLRARLPESVTRVVVADTRWRWLEGGEPGGERAPVLGDHPAYALFTSGSTGRPKSVVVPHRAIVNHTLWYVHEFQVSEADTFLQKTVFTFDTSLTEIYAALSSGARLVLPRPREHADPAYILQLIQRHGVTLLEDVPSFTALLVEERGLGDCRTLRWLNPGGEALPTATVKRVLERLPVRMANMYGPTEAAVDSVFEVCAPEGGPLAPIGRPVSNMRAYLLDERLEPVPQGVVGELYLGGVGLARGYLGHPDLTAERFIADPVSGDAGSRLYRTGDLARRLPDGDIVFIGRVDHQVKVRGMRIELGEIESVLATHARVETALLLQRPGPGGGQQLVAYAVSRGQVSTAELRAYLKERLPAYMVPAAFVVLPALPLTPSGKVDRHALPEPEEPSPATESRRSPRTPTEELVASVFSELLGRQVGVEDDFFELGGHSLLATQAISRLRAALGVALPLRALFESPTVAGLARAVSNGGQPLPPLEPAPAADAYPLSSAQRGVWLACQVRQDTRAYNMAEAYRLEGDLDVSALERALQAVVQRHEVLRTTFFLQEGEPRQRALTTPLPVLTREDLSGRPDAESAARMRCERDRTERFDLERGPLLRALLLRLGPQHHVLSFSLHHIAFDAWSTRVLIREVLALYEAFVAGQPSPLPPPRLQYRDYAVWQTRLMASDALADSRAYWHRKLSPLPPALELATDKPRPPVRSLEGAQVHFRLDAGLTPALRRLAREAGATPFMALQAALKVLLFAYSGQRDLAVGTLTAGRTDEALEEQIGFYLNTLVLRDRLEPSGGFLALLAQARCTTLEAFEHQLYPYDRLVQELRGRRDPRRQPLFDVLVNMMDAELTGADLAGAGWKGLRVEALEAEGRDAKFDLTWYFFDRGEHVEGTLEYSTDLFEPPTMERMVERFQRLLRWLVEHPRAALSEWELAEAPAPHPVRAAHAGPGTEPLSPHQERLWFIDRFERGNIYPEGPTYHNVPWLVRLRGGVDGPALEAALWRLALRHEALRTRLLTREERGWQRVEAEPTWRLERLEVDDPAGLEERAVSLVQRPLTLEEGPLVRAWWLRAGQDESLLALSLHHALVDWASLDVLFRDFTELYSAEVERREPRLSEAPLQARDFRHWQREFPPAALESLLFFWRRELGGSLKALELPTDRPRPAIHTYTAGRHRFSLPQDAVGELARRCGREPEAVLLAAFQAVLRRWAGHEEIVVGTVHAGREREGLADVVGPVGNLIVLRAFLEEEARFGDVASAATQTLQRARRHGDMPFDPLVLALKPEKDMSRTALFDVLFRTAPPSPTTSLPRGPRAERVDTHLGWGKYDVSLCLTPARDTWEGTLVYNRDLFDAPTLERLARHLDTLLRAAAAAPERPLLALPLMDEAERAAVLSTRDRKDFAVEGGLSQRFERQVARTPRAPALVSEGQVLTYAELEERANRLAHHLRGRGVGPESLVGICLERSAEVVVSILAILKAGGAYLPLDPKYPRDQLAFTVADSGARWVLMNEASAPALEGCGASCIDLAAEARAIAAEPGTPLGEAPLPEQAAYVIYTSGSTGKPKGCVVTHRNVLRLLDATASLFDFGPDDGFTLFHSYAFDFSVWELWGALAHGGRVVVVPYLVSRAPETFAQLLRTERVTVLNQTPSAFYALMDHLDEEAIRSLRFVIFGGEALDFQRPRPFLERHGEHAPRLINMYGITETTVHVTHRPVGAQEVASGTGSLIGAPLADLDLLVLDASLQPQPIGVAGELYVGGAGLARGYLGRPELTAERFIPHPFGRGPGERLYRTGDLARRTTHGDIEYLGRVDQQVKIRGFRIELGEIEAALSSHPRVRGALVMAHDFGGGDKRLVAYVASEDQLPVPELRRHLRDRLPPHMVPAAFIRLDAFPLTENGKVDRKALPTPERRGALEETEFAQARTPAEEVLVELWKQVLRVERVGIHDNFFDLGGDSILSIQILSRAAQRGLKLPAQAIFHHQTVAELAAAAQPLTATPSEQEPPSGELPALPIQRWFFEQRQPRPDHFNQAMLLTVRDVEPGVLERALEALVAHHDALRLRAWHSDEDDWRLEVLAQATGPVLERVDLTHLEPDQRSAAVEAHAAQSQSGLHLERGRPLAAVLYHLGGQEPDRLLLAIHHLAVDGVSWRILLEDLDTACRQLKANQPPRLPPRGTSLREWARRLRAHAELPEVLAELEYWVEQASRPSHLAVDEPRGDDTVASERSVTVVLDAEHTGQLMTRARKAYGNSVEELLLAALVRSLRLPDQRGLRVDLEGHGRQPFSPELDPSRTVGWLTVLYPVWLELPPDEEPGALLKATKERLLTVPRQGLGYGMLRYLHADARLARLPPSPVLFNFHGRVDSPLPADSAFHLAREAVGPLQDPGARRTHPLEVTGAIVGGQLELSFGYSAARHHPSTVEALARRYLSELEALLRHCLEPGAAGYTPSDFPESGLSQQALDDLLGDLSKPQ